jgi:histidinol-phosphate phosphatase family protein
MPIQINPNWTLFLDRDGVLNHQKEGSYIFSTAELHLYDGVLAAMKILAPLFRRIVIVTNQRGIGRGLMTLDDVHLIHQHLKTTIEQQGGRIDGIYVCPDVSSSSLCRKPNTGMALQAQSAFPDIVFQQSIMVGNSLSDMEFGRNIGAKNIFLNTTAPHITAQDDRIDFCFPSLLAFAEAIHTNR